MADWLVAGNSFVYFFAYEKFGLIIVRAVSSFGRAPRLQRGGGRFEPGTVHFFMIIPKTLTQNTTYYTGALILQKILAFVYFTFLARGLGVEDLGKYSFAFSFTTIFSVFVDVGLNSVLTREVAKDKEQTKKILANVLGIKTILSLFTYLLIVGIINLMSYPALTKNLVYLTGIIMLLDTFSATFWGVLRGNQNLKFESLGIILFQTIVVGLGMFLLYLNVGVVPQVLAVLAGSSFLFLYSLFEMYRRTRIVPTINFDKSLIKILLKISIPFALTGILARLNTQVDTIFLSKVGCASQQICDTNVGIYSVATKITLAIHFIPLAFVAALFPAMSEYYANNKEKLARVFEKAMRYLMIISIPVAFGIGVLAPDFVPKIFGAEYKSAVLPLQILMFSLVFLFLTFPIGSLLNATSRQLLNTKQVAIAALINFLLNFLLVPKFTYIGGAFSSLISTLVMFYLGLRASGKIMTYNHKYLWQSFWQCFLSGIIMAAVLWLLLFKLHFIILIMLGLVIYFFCLLLFNGLTKNDFSDMLISMKIKR